MLFGTEASATLGDTIANIGLMFVGGLAERWAATADSVAQRGLATLPQALLAVLLKAAGWLLLLRCTAHISIANTKP